MTLTIPEPPATVAPAFLRLQTLSEEHELLRVRLIGQLHRAKRANVRQEAFYEGSRRARDLGIAIPPNLQDVEAVVAWPEIVVDVISERLSWRGWSSDDDTLGLDDIYDENHLRVESGQGFLDALICGLSYMTVGTGNDGEPDVLVMPGSPNRMTATWDPRLRRASDGMAEIHDERGHLIGWKLYVPGETVTIERRRGRMEVTDRDQHGLDRVPIAVLRNRPRSDRPDGRSEITRAVRSLTETGMRTLLGMEITREFYGAPKRYLMGADASMFVDEDGNKVDQWDALVGSMLAIERDANGDVPTVGEFKGASPAPFSEILRTLTQMVSSASGVPAHHLGFTTDNPASEGAIARADARLDKRAEDRQGQFNLGLVELAQLCVLWRDGELPPTEIRSLWTPVGTVAPGAAADRAAKMLAAGVIRPEWDFTLEQFGLDDDEIRRVRQEQRRGSGSTALRAITEAAARGRLAVSSGDDDAAG